MTREEKREIDELLTKISVEINKALDAIEDYLLDVRLRADETRRDE